MIRTTHEIKRKRVEMFKVRGYSILPKNRKLSAKLLRYRRPRAIRIPHQLRIKPPPTRSCSISTNVYDINIFVDRFPNLILSGHFHDNLEIYARFIPAINLHLPAAFITYALQPATGKGRIKNLRNGSILSEPIYEFKIRTCYLF